MPEGEEMFKFHGYSGPCPKGPKAPQADVSFEELKRRGKVLEKELEALIAPSVLDAERFRRALDNYIDMRVGWILSQTVIDGARIIRVGECPNP